MCYILGMKRNARSRMDYATEQARRIEAGRLFAEGLSQAEVARRLGVSRQSASRWFHLWKANGVEALRGAGRTGRKRQLSDEDLRRLEALLIEGPQAQGYETNLWTLKRIATVVRKRFGVSYHPGHVWKLLRQLGWSCQRPERRARERDEAAIRRWLKYRWPRIKKKRTTCRPC
jgi:transposase